MRILEGEIIALRDGENGEATSAGNREGAGRHVSNFEQMDHPRCCLEEALRLPCGTGWRDDER